MGKYIAAGIAFILVIAGGYYFLQGNKAAPAATEPIADTAQARQMATSTYATSTYSVVYPADFVVDPAFMNTEVNPKKPIMATKFTIPMTMATGTNLAADTSVSIEQLPRAKSCTGDIYLKENVTPTTQTDNGVTYSVARSALEGEGDHYDETVYAIVGSNPCTAIRYSVHSISAGTAAAFDQNALIGAFDKIRASLTLTR